MKIYGYCRISTAKQVLTRQIENISKEYPTSTIIEEVYTGTKSNRPKWNSLLKMVKEGDTIVFDSVSRMSRNSEEGVKQYFELMNRGINLVFLKESYINTDTYKEQLGTSSNVSVEDNDLDSTIMKGIREYLVKLIEKQVIIAFNQSEKEVQDLRKRTSEGLRVAKAEGKQVGRVTGDKLNVKKKLEKAPLIKSYLERGLKDTEIMELVKLSRNTYYKYKKEILDKE